MGKNPLGKANRIVEYDNRNLKAGSKASMVIKRLYSK